MFYGFNLLTICVSMAKSCLFLSFLFLKPVFKNVPEDSVGIVDAVVAVVVGVVDVVWAILVS